MYPSLGTPGIELERLFVSVKSLNFLSEVFFFVIVCKMRLTCCFEDVTYINKSYFIC